MSDIRRIPTKRHRDEYDRWVAFLNAASIRHEDNVDATYGVYEDNRLIATGSIYRNILKCIAVCKDHTGGPVLNQLISFLMSEVMEQGYTTVYVYTKPESVVSFKYLGFKEIASVEDLVFLEKAVHGFDEYLNKLKELADGKPDSSAIVMNANPFTKGHQYLVEYASQHSQHVYVFVLSEDISEFPAAVRFNLVKAGTAHLKNVEVVETGNYMVSSQTFPSYFLKEEADVTYVHASLDASIFRQVAQVMHITKRFVGEEPYSQATAIYNQALSSILNPEIELEIIPRKEFDYEVISASRVRQALKINDLETVKKLVPETTLEYLVSDEGQHLVHELRNGGKYHDKV